MQNLHNPKGENTMGLFGKKELSSEDIDKWGKSRNVRKLIGALDDSNSYLASRAADALAGIGDKSTLEPLLVYMTKHGSSYGLSQAISKMAEDASPKLIPLFIELLAIKDYQTGNIAAFVLDKMGAAAAEPLIEALKDKRLEVRKWASQLLGALRDKRAVDGLITALDDDDGNMRLVTAKSLAQIGDRRAIEPLKAELGKKRQHDYAASSVREAIEALEKNQFVADINSNETVKVTIKISGLVHGSSQYAGSYQAELPLDSAGPQLLNSIAQKIIWQGQTRFYTGYQLSCRNGSLRSNGSGSITKPVTLRDAGVKAADTLEFIDWGGEFM
jgi:hypothetical protein